VLSNSITRDGNVTPTTSNTRNTPPNSGISPSLNWSTQSDRNETPFNNHDISTWGTHTTGAGLVSSVVNVVNGGEGHSPSSAGNVADRTFIEGELIVLNPGTRDGYFFGGWRVYETNPFPLGLTPNDSASNAFTMPTENVWVEAIWIAGTAPTHALTIHNVFYHIVMDCRCGQLDDFGESSAGVWFYRVPYAGTPRDVVGQLPAAQNRQFAAGETIDLISGTAPNSPFVFDGWAVRVSGDYGVAYQSIEPSVVMSAGGLTIYAIWFSGSHCENVVDTVDDDGNVIDPACDCGCARIQDPNNPGGPMIPGGLCTCGTCGCSANNCVDGDSCDCGCQAGNYNVCDCSAPSPCECEEGDRCDDGNCGYDCSCCTCPDNNCETGSDCVDDCGTGTGCGDLCECEAPAACDCADNDCQEGGDCTACGTAGDCDTAGDCATNCTCAVVSQQRTATVTWSVITGGVENTTVGFGQGAASIDYLLGPLLDRNDPAASAWGGWQAIANNAQVVNLEASDPFSTFGVTASGFRRISTVRTVGQGGNNSMTVHRIYEPNTVARDVRVTWSARYENGSEVNNRGGSVMVHHSNNTTWQNAAHNQLFTGTTGDFSTRSFANTGYTWHGASRTLVGDELRIHIVFVHGNAQGGIYDGGNEDTAGDCNCPDNDCLDGGVCGCGVGTTCDGSCPCDDNASPPCDCTNNDCLENGNCTCAGNDGDCDDVCNCDDSTTNQPCDCTNDDCLENGDCTCADTGGDCGNACTCDDSTTNQPCDCANNDCLVNGNCSCADNGGTCDTACTCNTGTGGGTGGGTGDTGTGGGTGGGTGDTGTGDDTSADGDTDTGDTGTGTDNNLITGDDGDDDSFYGGYDGDFGGGDDFGGNDTDFGFDLPITDGADADGANNIPIDPPTDNRLVETDFGRVELDDNGVPVGIWVWDEDEFMWLFDLDVPIGRWVPPVRHDATNQLIETEFGWLELDDLGVPLGHWTWDEDEFMWLFDPEVPLAALTPTAMPLTGVGVANNTALLIALIGFSAATTATSLHLIRRTRKKAS